MIGAAENMHKYEIVLGTRQDVAQTQQLASKFLCASQLKKVAESAHLASGKWRN